MPAGYQRRTDDGVIGTSGTAKILYSINWVSDGTAGEVKVYDGSSTAGTLVHDEFGVINRGVYTPFGGGDGIVLKNGIYLDIDSHVTGITVAYRELI